MPCCKSLCRQRGIPRLNCLTDKARYPSCWCVVALLCPCPALLEYWPVSWNLRQARVITLSDTPEPSCDQTHGWTILEELDGLANFTNLHWSHGVYRGSNWPNDKGKRWISNVYCHKWKNRSVSPHKTHSCLGGSQAFHSPVDMLSVAPIHKYQASPLVRLEPITRPYIGVIPCKRSVPLFIVLLKSICTVESC